MSWNAKKIFMAIMLFAIICGGFWWYNRNPHQITTIKSFAEVDFNAIDTNTLVVFDVDETLIQPIDSYSINEFTPQGNAFKKQLFESHPEIKDWDEYMDILIKQVQRPLLEPMVIEKINALQKRGVIVIACTGLNTGKYGSYDRLERWRYEHLASFGFEGSFNDLIIDFAMDNKKPVFYKGILATDTLIKGPVLFEFLNRINYKPKKIIMFDDTIEYLKSTVEESKKRGIAFQGYLYTGAHTKPWDQKLIEFQADYLLKHKRWLSDEQAYELMQQELKPAYS